MRKLVFFIQNLYLTWDYEIVDQFLGSQLIFDTDSSKDVVKFDDLLSKTCPNISFLQYKNLYNKTVSVETRGESDYYGGYVKYAYYVCDTPLLYDLLIEIKAIEGIK